MSSRSRAGSQRGKAAFKEKFVAIYEQFLRGQDAAQGNPNFWEELFLLRVNAAFLRQGFAAVPPDADLSFVATVARRALDALADKSPFRVTNALETLRLFWTLLVQRAGQDNVGQVIAAMCGSLDNGEEFWTTLMTRVGAILKESEFEPSVKRVALELLLAIVTGFETMGKNPLVQYVVSADLGLLDLVVDESTRHAIGRETILLFVLLVNFQKYEASNPVGARLAGLADHEVLLALANLISHTLAKCNERYASRLTHEPGGVLSGVTGVLGWFLGGSSGAGGGDGAAAPATASASDGRQGDHIVVTEGGDEHSGGSLQEVGPMLVCLYELIYQNKSFFKAAATPQAVEYLGRFLTFASYLLQDHKDFRSICYSKLCFIILLCLAEDPASIAFLHGDGQQMSIPVYRKGHKETHTVRAATEAPVCSVLDVMVQFIVNNQVRKLKVDLFSMCFAVIHRILCAEKKSKARVAYQWPALWKALIGFVKFIVAHELTTNQHVLLLSFQVVNILNMFITFGDDLLPTSDDYDHLYYELVRAISAFDRLQELAVRHDTTTVLCKDLANIRTINAHFSSKISAWSDANRVASLSPEQVMAIIKTNYVSLKLRLQDKLDVYEPYLENPREVSFFRQLAWCLVKDARRDNE